MSYQLLKLPFCPDFCVLSHHVTSIWPIWALSLHSESFVGGCTAVPHSVPLRPGVGASELVVYIAEFSRQLRRERLRCDKNATDGKNTEERCHVKLGLRSSLQQRKNRSRRIATSSCIVLESNDSWCCPFDSRPISEKTTRYQHIVTVCHWCQVPVL